MLFIYLYDEKCEELLKIYLIKFTSVLNKFDFL